MYASRPGLELDLGEIRELISHETCGFAFIKLTSRSLNAIAKANRCARTHAALVAAAIGTALVLRTRAELSLVREPLLGTVAAPHSRARLDVHSAAHRRRTLRR